MGQKEFPREKQNAIILTKKLSHLAASIQCIAIVLNAIWSMLLGAIFTSLLRIVSGLKYTLILLYRDRAFLSQTYEIPVRIIGFISSLIINEDFII